MTRASFISWPEEGHVTPTIAIADALRSRGHAVRFLGIPDFGSAYRERGYAFEPFGAEHLPAGSVNHPTDTFRPGVFKRYAKLWESVDLSHVRGEVVIVDFLIPYAAFVAHRFGARVVMLTTNLPYTRQGGLPPLTTTLGVASSAADRFRIAAAWRLRLARRSATRRLSRLLGTADPLAVLESLAQRAGFDRSAANGEAAVGFGVPFPELVLCPRELELPHDVPSRRHYVEPLVARARVRSPAAAPQTSAEDGLGGELDPARKLILTALGSQTHRYPKSSLHRIFGGVIAAARERPSWQFVIATGSVLPESLGPLPGNVVVRPRIPQVSLLARASLLVGHGGLNSVKEALAHAVPLVVFPMLNDQAGNAARIRHHGLGAMGDATSSIRSIADLVLHCAGDRDMAAGARRMSAVLSALEAEAPGVSMLDAALRSLPTPLFDGGLAGG